jgi:hypothetical protein
VATEGSVTEPAYFNRLNNITTSVEVRLLKRKEAKVPTGVLKTIKNYIAASDMRKGDEAWLVIDKDQWKDEQIAELHRWSQEDPKYGLALSNPKFEYWLLLHFDDGSDVTSARICDDRLRHHLPHYDKSLGVLKITTDMINSAIQRAKRRNDPPCIDWPRTCGSTTVHILVEHILSADK